jgi:hypothetical protein
METPVSVPVLGKEIEQSPRPEDAVAWEPASRQWFNQEQLEFFLENEQSMQRRKFAQLGDPERVRGAHFAGAAAAKVLASVKRKGAEKKNLANPFDIGDALEEARRSLPEYEEILAEEQAALDAALAGEEVPGPVPADEALSGGSSQPPEKPGAQQIV